MATQQVLSVRFACSTAWPADAYPVAKSRTNGTLKYLCSLAAAMRDLG